MHAQVEGARLGHYQLGPLLGAGGMGEVYLATDLELGRTVAIKLVTAAEAGDSTLRRRLVQEAKAVAALDHPCICPVYDIGFDPSGRPYMVMQHVHGEPLSTRLSRGPLPEREALVLCAGIADALSAAHQQGIIHRDLKPHNIMVTPNGQPKLLDFGIAKLLPGIGTSAAAGETVSALTDPHALVGTPAYMSPEQAQQRPLDGRSDLFALGCILFECLTGRRAFPGRTTLEVLGQILHVHPDVPSTLRPELGTRYDELCRRLLAKEPSDRFQSAHEVVGALRVLQPDTSRGPGDRGIATVDPVRLEPPPPGPTPRPRLRLALMLAASAFVLLGALGAWRWFHPQGGSVPREAEGWYQRGTEALREGAFQKAAKSFQEGIRVFPNYPMAYARLAEARAEMDDHQGAQQALIGLLGVLPDQSRLTRDEQLRLDAIRSLVVGKVDQAVTAYRELADRRPSDASAWLDLGRAQEAAAQIADARDSYARAVVNDKQFAAGYLRLGIVEADQGRRGESLEAYAEAERLYRAASNKEGEVEVLIRRGGMFDSVGEVQQARETLERALTAAGALESDSQVVRAQMLLSAVIASEGRFSDAERLASTAVEAALDAGLDTIAAAGLVDLASTIQLSQPEEATRFLNKAITLARNRGAQRTGARAASQMASLQLQEGRPQEALSTLQPALDFFREHKYRAPEITALLIASRAYQKLDDLTRAREIAGAALKEAEISGDESQRATALVNLAGQAAVLGSLPEALALRNRAETIHRQQKSLVALPFDLTNRAELLIRLGQGDAAEIALKEVDAGIEREIDAYVQLQRRVTYLRALAAVVRNDFRRAAEVARMIEPYTGNPDSPSVLGPAILQYAEVKVRWGKRRTTSGPIGHSVTDRALERERQYWAASTALADSNAREAMALAGGGLAAAASIGNDELAWRLAAVASVAAGALARAQEQSDFRAKASSALERLRSSWGTSIRDYENRLDLAGLRKAADI